MSEGEDTTHPIVRTGVADREALMDLASSLGIGYPTGFDCDFGNNVLRAVGRVTEPLPDPIKGRYALIFEVPVGKIEAFERSARIIENAGQPLDRKLVVVLESDLPPASVVEATCLDYGAKRLRDVFVNYGGMPDTDYSNRPATLFAVPKGMSPSFKAELSEKGRCSYYMH